MEQKSPYRELALQHAIHVDSRAELPPHTGQCWYFAPSTGRTFALKGTQRQLLDQLRTRPLYASSRLKLSSYIDKMRKAGAPIETHFFRNAQTGGSFGIYSLSDRVVAKG